MDFKYFQSSPTCDYSIFGELLLWLNSLYLFRFTEWHLVWWSLFKRTFYRVLRAERFDIKWGLNTKHILCIYLSNHSWIRWSAPKEWRWEAVCRWTFASRSDDILVYPGQSSLSLEQLNSNELRYRRKRPASFVLQHFEGLQSWKAYEKEHSKRYRGLLWFQMVSRWELSHKKWTWIAFI